MPGLLQSSAEFGSPPGHAPGMPSTPAQVTATTATCT